MATDDKRWVVHGERSLYESDWVRLSLVDLTTPSGRRFEHHVVRMNTVVVSLVVRSGRVLLIRRHRFVDDTWGWELPAGIVEIGEEPVSAAVRETVEETGWRPTGPVEVLRWQPAIGIADTPHLLFAARKAELVGAASDPDEASAVEWFNRQDLVALVAKGFVRDGASLVGVLHALTSAEGGL